MSKKTVNIRTRIAPSPTGFLHIGTARTAFFNYLFARQKGGKCILRIEDTDRERSDKKYEKDIFEELQWLGIDTDESPEIGGPHTLYRQSERTEIYKQYIKRLLDDGMAFYCFHSEKELAEEKEKLLAAKRPLLHLCEYRTLDPKEAALLTETKSDYIIRFKTPVGRVVSFTDLIRGEVKFSSDLLGDFSIAKRVDVPLYNFVVVVDDYEMQISHVIRGEDHIANTPKQILIIEALGFPMPQYAHLPLILGTDRSKLSKRHGATSVVEYREAGYLPEALCNFMALLGWSPGDDQEIFSRAELIKEFSLEKIQKSGAVFDMAKLEWMNGEYIRRKSTEELRKLCMPYLERVRFPENKELGIRNKEYVAKVVALEQPRLKKLSEIGDRTDYFFREPEYDKELLRWKQMTDEEVKGSLGRALQILESHAGAASKEALEKTFFDAIGDGDRGNILWPLRVALTGKKASPGPFEIMEIMGVAEVKKRLEAAAKKILREKFTRNT